MENKKQDEKRDNQSSGNGIEIVKSNSATSEQVCPCLEALHSLLFMFQMYFKPFVYTPCLVLKS